MSVRRTQAVPIREGYVPGQGRNTLIWIEHRWNTGEVTRSYLVDPKSVPETHVQVRTLHRGPFGDET